MSYWYFLPCARSLFILLLVLVVVASPVACACLNFFHFFQPLMALSHFSTPPLLASFVYINWCHTELIIILTKMIMTGAMSVVAPGSPVQLLLATLVMMTFTLATLKLAPYRNKIDDWMSFAVSLVSSGNTLAGFVLITDKMITDSGNSSNFNPGIIEVLLLVVNVSLLFLQLLIMVLMKWGCWEKLKKSACVRGLACDYAKSTKVDAVLPIGGQNPRKVVPENSSNERKTSSSADSPDETPKTGLSAELKTWGASARRHN